ncbi:hypothetical protein COO60DRAFT_773217 [Scenedesmus sp. NREL 46B-D3]|nr:hypothetical protein COO60DRAFT_773217 [Scenedesmus sp. NREL 46B-D3]
MTKLISQSQQRRNFAAANLKQRRCNSRRREQRPPNPFLKGRPRQRVQDGDDLELDESTVADLQCCQGDSDHCQRVQQQRRNWDERRAANTNSMQQYEAYQEAEDQLRQQQSCMQLMNERVLSAVARHCCHSVPDVDSCTSVASMRSVACHMLGASFWLPVPTVACQACGDTWEVSPADIGCFGNTPVLPNTWFDKQFLRCYRQLLLTGGVSSSTFAGALSTVAKVIEAAAASAASPAGPGGQGAVPTIDQRHLQSAWLEYSRAAEYAHDPHALLREELSFLGPAGLCPACAGTPDSAGAAEVAAALPTPGHSAEHLFEPGKWVVIRRNEGWCCCC